MLEDRRQQQEFFSATLSVSSPVAAFLEPTLTVLASLLTTWGFALPVLRADMALCMRVIAHISPGYNRFKDRLPHAGTEIISSWVAMLAILGPCGAPRTVCTSPEIAASAATLDYPGDSAYP